MLADRKQGRQRQKSPSQLIEKSCNARWRNGKTGRVRAVLSKCYCAASLLVASRLEETSERGIETNKTGS